MIFTKEELNNFTKSSSKEWLISNGIGSFASSTIIGLNTRKYHGLLVAALNPPAQRNVILSKVDEGIRIGGKDYYFYTNQTNDSISLGYEYEQEFEFDIVPKFCYKILDVGIIKKICFEYGKNTVYIHYKIKNGKDKSSLFLSPLLNYRSFHATSNVCDLKYNQEYIDNILNVKINDGVPIKIWVSDSRYNMHENDYFKNMYYLEEEKRGFLDLDNHIVPGTFEIEINPYEVKEITFVCSVEKSFTKINGAEKIIKEEIRKKNLVKLSRYKK